MSRCPVSVHSSIRNGSLPRAVLCVKQHMMVPREERWHNSISQTAVIEAQAKPASSVRKDPETRRPQSGVTYPAHLIS